ncbi:nuclear receptor subfamily 6 group A member 1 [Lepeophtheirus salmonis]|uniref:nuclear receptor subfamily 6 group A member 1 n=1 Tax=Lepeophtheirus salmonis TaxID=72036 RepID=UPI001AE359DF|nr:vitamin D3 receptor-like [Lepeophtheirus salmonis]
MFSSSYGNSVPMSLFHGSVTPHQHFLSLHQASNTHNLILNKSNIKKSTGNISLNLQNERKTTDTNLIDINKKRRKPKMTEMVCNVCGDKAPDHIHYGGIACFSCRAFFRRSVPKHTTYFCSTDQACMITITTRKNCQFCRYKKCLESGMKPSWVLSEEEKSSRNLIKYVRKNKTTCGKNVNNNNTIEVNLVSHLQSNSAVQDRLTLQSSSSSASSSASSSPAPISPYNIIHFHSLCFTTEESRHIDNLIFAQDSTRNLIPMPELVMDEILEMTNISSLNMTSKGITEIYRVIYSRVAKFATYIDHFEELTSDDKKLLLSKNMDSMAILRTVVCFNKDGTGNLTSQLKNTGSPIYGNVGPYYISVERVFRHPWAKSEEHRHLFKETFRKIASLGLGEKAAMLLQLVTLFSVLDLPVQERNKIEQFQEQMALLCYRYLKSQKIKFSSNDMIKVFVLLSELRYLSNLLTDQPEL